MHKCIYRFYSRNARSYNSKTNTTVFEIRNGVGGSEAMLFADELSQIYMKYFQHMRWPFQMIEKEESDLGGLKICKMLVDSANSFEGLIQEAGVHRVQRVPKTEKSGRMHTSTISISVVPKSVLDITLNERDVEMQTKRSSGPGGQHVNKTESAVRLLHKPSGVVVECQESRFQIENRKIAMKKLLSELQRVNTEKIASEMSVLKRSQVGNADRNEKIRTYNFPQDRITEHRLSKNYSNLKGLFAGDVSVLEKIINDYR